MIAPTPKYEYRVVWRREGDKSQRTRIYQTGRGAMNWAYTVMGYRWDHSEKAFMPLSDPEMVSYYEGLKIPTLLGVSVQRRKVDSDWATTHLPILHVRNREVLSA